MGQGKSTDRERMIQARDAEHLFRSRWLLFLGFDQDLFLGIPYAQDTGGQNRFRIPQFLNETWSGVRQATEYGHACPGLFPELDSAYGMSEDCLSINIVRPSGLDSLQKLPIMFWLYGGSYRVGTTGLPSYNLSYLVERSVETGRPVLGVSINYRKAAWGNIYSEEVRGTGDTNLALRDMRKALAWVSENIASFGGDPNLVTIWGESSGAFAVGQLLMTYGGRTDGLFHRSIQQSGSATSTWCNGTDWYQPVYNDIVVKANCTGEISTLDCLREVLYQVLFPILNTYPLVNDGTGWYPTVDGGIFPVYPTEALSTGKFATSIPHLCGVNTDEGTDSVPVGPTWNSDDDIYNHLLHDSGFGFPGSTIREIMKCYPNEPAIGIPANTGTETFADQGGQHKRIAAILGDVFYHGPNMNDARAYTKFAQGESKTYVYRFNTRGWVDDNDNSGPFAPAQKGVAHTAELPFVFNNPSFLGPWLGYRELSNVITDMWINFAYDGSPNGDNEPYSMNDSTALAGWMSQNLTDLGQSLDNVNATGLMRRYWPAYDEDAKGLNLVLQTQGQGGLYVETDTYRLEGREYLSQWARRRHV